MKISSRSTCAVCGKSPQEHSTTSDHTPVFELSANGRTYVDTTNPIEWNPAKIAMDHRNSAGQGQPTPMIFWPDTTSRALAKFPAASRWTPKMTATPRALQAIALAESSAAKRNSQPTTVDLLYGLLQLPVDTVFHRVKISADAVKGLIGRGWPMGSHDDFKDVVDRAAVLAAAGRGNASYLSCDDLAMAMLGIGTTLGGPIFRPEQVQASVLNTVRGLGFGLKHLVNMALNGPVSDESVDPPAAPPEVADFEEV